MEHVGKLTNTILVFLVSALFFVKEKKLQIQLRLYDTYLFQLSPPFLKVSNTPKLVHILLVYTSLYFNHSCLYPQQCIKVSGHDINGILMYMVCIKTCFLTKQF